MAKLGKITQRTPSPSVFFNALSCFVTPYSAGNPQVTRLATYNDRSLRSLTRLEATASTSRILNLVAAWKRNARDPDYWARPFFRNPTLNRSMVIKHRLRWHEGEILPKGRSNATKVVLPIDLCDLRSGARSFFVGERDMGQFLAPMWRGSEEKEIDLALLETLDALPSFDPFLMRERMTKAGFTPARCYFNLSDADAAQMMDFVRSEIEPLIGISFIGRHAGLSEKTAKLATKIMSNAGDAELEPLRLGMGMSQADFEEGIFCWKGFIYYKWSLAQMSHSVGPILTEIGSVRPRGWGPDESAAISLARLRLVRAVNQARAKVRASLDIYEAAYDELTRQGRPQAFRDFLLNAPRLFFELGERLGALQHMVSFWRFRFPEGRRIALTAEDMVDLLADFHSSLGADEEPSPKQAVLLTESA